LLSDVPELCFDYWNSISAPRPYNVPDEVTVQISNGEDNPTKRHASNNEEDEAPITKKLKKDAGVQEYMIDSGYKLPKKEVDWNQNIKKLTVQASPDDSRVIHAYIEWQDNKKTIHDIESLHENIPKKVNHSLDSFFYYTVLI
jgi:uncharacterized protein YxeA